MRKRRPWSELEIALLREAYPDHMTEAIAAVLDRPIGQVYSKARNLGLKKSATFLASDASGRLQKLSQKGHAFRFERGHVPANKGLRRPGYAPGRMAETQFKQGRKPQEARNYLPIGTTRVTRDGILERKITDDPNLNPTRRWVSVARLVWEAAHGPIPPKHVVRFLPGMRTSIEAEITVDRLECISLVESMRRNSIHRYPKEIKDAIRSVAVLNRRINRVQKHQ